MITQKRNIQINDITLVPVMLFACWTLLYMVIKSITETKWRKHKDAAQMSESNKYIQ